jgi:two-component system nitrogen regulation response regulator GlnG
MPGSILVADDDKAMLNIYTRIFSDTGYTVCLASSFSEAARLINENNYDLLITDLILGDGLGTELIKMFEKKRDGARSLLVTGSVHELTPEQLPKVYFEKPFKLEVFMAAVTDALSGAALSNKRKGAIMPRPGRSPG